MLTEWISLGISVIVLLIIPFLAISIRGAVRWVKVEDRLEGLIKQVETLVMDKDKTHIALNEQMREDRAATDKRLRWLEENFWELWKKGNN